MKGKLLLYIRTINIWLYSSTVFILGFVISVLRPLNPSNLYLIAKMLTFKGFNILGIKFEKRGAQVLDKIDGPVVYMSNHQNNIDLLAGSANFLPKTIFNYLEFIIIR